MNVSDLLIFLRNGWHTVVHRMLYHSAGLANIEGGVNDPTS